MTTTLNLKQLLDNIWQVTKDVDLIYSELDDEETGKGWYLQKFPGGICSELLYKSDNEAVEALKAGKAKFIPKIRKSNSHENKN